MASLNAQVQKVAGLAGTPDVNPWEDTFIASIVRQTQNGKNTSSLTEKQVDVLERLYERHFAS
ncbi:hypothetical protein BH10PSE18_BH10PSE18_07990 [soil metagenome]